MNTIAEYYDTQTLRCTEWLPESRSVRIVVLLSSKARPPEADTAIGDCGRSSIPVGTEVQSPEIDLPEAETFPDFA